MRILRNSQYNVSIYEGNFLPENHIPGLYGDPMWTYIISCYILAPLSVNKTTGESAPAVTECHWLRGLQVIAGLYMLLI